MSYTSGFFDAIDQGGGDYDRVYSAETFAHYFSLLVKNGVFPDPSTGMQVKASSSPDMHVSVQPGNGWINGYYITVPENSPEVLTVPTANPSLSRIDSVIMGLNYVEREIQLYIKPGAVSASPIPVSLQRDNDLYEMELAQIRVGAGVASIVQANITDMRTNTSRCGIVKGTIEQIDTTDLFAQYDDAFQTWFSYIKDRLSGNVATNLQNQINELKDNKVNVSDKATTAEAQAASADNKWMSPLKVWNLLVAKKCTEDDIIRYALLVMSAESGKQATIIPSVTGDFGIREGQSSSTVTITVPLNSLPSNALVGFFNKIATSTGAGSAAGSYTLNYTFTVKFGSTVVTVDSGTVTSYSDAANIINKFGSYNIMTELGKYLTRADSIVLTLLQTKASGKGYGYRAANSGAAVVNYVTR